MTYPIDNLCWAIKFCSVAYVLTNCVDGVLYHLTAVILLLCDIVHIRDMFIDNTVVTNFENYVIFTAHMVAACIILKKPKVMTILWLVFPFALGILTGIVLESLDIDVDSLQKLTAA